MNNYNKLILAITKVDLINAIMQAQKISISDCLTLSSNEDIMEMIKRDKTRCKAVRRLLIDLYAIIEKIEQEDNNAITDIELLIDESYL